MALKCPGICTVMRIGTEKALVISGLRINPWPWVCNVRLAVKVGIRNTNGYSEFMICLYIFNVFLGTSRIYK
jgi:hypothetical protein